MSAKQLMGIVGIASLGLFAGAASAVTIDYQQGDDNALVTNYQGADDAAIKSADNDDYNYGGQGYFQSGQIQVPNTSAGVIRGLMRWDLSSLAGQYSSITSVTLDWFNDSSNENGTAYAFSLKLANADWVEGTASGGTESGSSSWNSKGPGAWAGGAGAGVGGTDYDSTALGSFTWSSVSFPYGHSQMTLTGGSRTLTQLINEWSGDQSLNAGMIFISDQEGFFGAGNHFRYLHVNSSEQALVDNRPTLTINYVAAVPEPGMFVACSFGLLGLLRRRRA